MQISRHWRMNAQRYRLEGVRYQNGTVSLQNRPMVQSEEAEQEEIDEHHTDKMLAISPA
jgi:hypothetical protein